ncbi:MULTISPECIES: heavy metal translocating P-type ATPase [unclassified Paracoccus (in: a-proteobacteria)]|uniref:heavy metal translocating P-type ATPase n=1 Tax=unclassified Paracoccus (in: a-proteobacteria) TaxID=2688777 RepID=UPI0012B30A9D|nr:MULTISPECIES: heavy metal translocating P-type ATPase [unclassified Paracoccus (in: a-proteobacteria)]UXU76378.1 heavy metal translocating P-type ATPase [Paracoccus sp. SMMA_5]UXU82284.1 heavy metal translocating P-type ATPase [Paracoccus sp. SMMA_5_TC]
MADTAFRDHDARLSACPACDAAPLAQRIASGASGTDQAIILSLPTIHCATCITDVERALGRYPGVRDARVNLTLRRVTIDAPGLTAEELIPVVEAIGYEAHELDPAALSASAADRQGRDILMRIGVAGFAMMNIMILSVAVWSGAEAATRDMFHWISGAIALPTVVFAGQPFFASAWRSLRHGRLGMDVPISLALILASAISFYETLHSGRHAYFDAAVMLCFFLLIGRYLDYRTRAVARSAAEELTALEVPRAFRITAQGDEPVAVASLLPGDLIRIRPGARVPADGEIVEGCSEIDRALLTGESIPVPAEPGHRLSAGEVNLTGPLIMRVTAAGRDSSLARLTALVAAAESSRGHYTGLADRASRLYSPLVHLLALCSLMGWYLSTGDLRLAVNVAAAVLIITCPCALGLAVPAVITAASGRLFRRGMLIKDGTALERLADVDTVVFDKTGTLTMGVPQLVSLQAIPEDARPMALALARASAHPLSQALAQALIEAGVRPALLTDLREVPGHGVRGLFEGRELRLGRADWVGAEHGEAPLSASWLSLREGPPLRLEFSDRLRPGAEECIRGLVSQGMRLMLLSGDAIPVVRDLAARLGIEEWQAQVMPMEKAAVIDALRQNGGRVLMVGDGLNDTAALTAAHVSISPASALDAARVASDVVMMGSDLAPVAEVIAVARSARARIKENFAISVIYNIVAVPIAIAGMATPLMAALAMSLSSISVTLNALRLR